jgi:hypothetical protein
MVVRFLVPLFITGKNAHQNAAFLYNADSCKASHRIVKFVIGYCLRCTLFNYPVNTGQFKVNPYLPRLKLDAHFSPVTKG